MVFVGVQLNTKEKEDQGLWAKTSPVRTVLPIFPGKSCGPGGPKNVEKCPPADTGTKI